MIKTFKKAISVFVAVAFIMSLVPFGAFASAEEPGKIAFQNYAYSRSSATNITDARNHVYGYDVNGELHSLHVGGSFSSYAQLNLAGYEAVLAHPDTTAEVRLEAGFKYSGAKIYNIRGVIIPDDADDYDASTLTWNIANGLGMHKADLPELFIKSDSTIVGPDAVTSMPVNMENLNSAIRDGNSVISVAFRRVGSNDSAFRINSEKSGFFVTYDKSKIDNKAYVENLASLLEWEKVSTDEKTAVQAPLATSYAGASIKWSAFEDGLISEDGVITPATSDKNVTLTATLSYAGLGSVNYSATKTFDVTVKAEEAKKASVRTSNPKWTRDKDGGSVFNPEDQSGTKGILVSNNGATNYRYAFGQFDLAGYEEILGNPGTKVTYTVTAGVGYSANRARDFKVQLLNDEDDYNDNTTYKEFASVNLKEDGAYTLFERVSSDAARAYTSSAEVDVKALNDVLRQGATNSIVSYGISTNHKDSTFISMSAANEGLVISYFESEIDNEAYIEEIKKEFSWDALSADSAAAVVNSLPTYFRGAKVTWSSKKGVITSDGQLIRSRDEAVSDTITATVEFKGYSFTKDFDITVAQYLPTVITIKSATATYIDANSPSDAAGTYEKCYDTYKIKNQGLYAKDDQMMFMKWNLSGYEAILDAAQSIALTWNCKSYSAGTKVTLTVMNNVNDTWHNSDLTYNTAVETGMYTDPGVYSITGIEPKTEMYISTPELLDAFRTALAQAPASSVVSTKFAGEKWDRSAFRSSSRYYDLEISYYPEDVKSEEEFLAEKVAAMPWRAVSEQSIDEVLLNVSLPNKFYGKTIEWVSSDAAVITSSGEVAKVSEDKPVKLTATVDGKYTKTFDVTVPAKKFAIRAFSIRQNGSKAYQNIPDVYIYATEEVKIPMIAIATYNKGRLVGLIGGSSSSNRIQFLKDYTIKPGITSIKGDYRLSDTDEVKVFLWEGVDSEVNSAANPDSLRPVYSVNNK